MLFLFEEKPIEVDDKVLISSLTFTIEQNEHVAIVGSNGVGKSTLLNNIHINEDIDTALMEQDLSSYSNYDVLSYVMLSYPDLSSLRNDLSDEFSLNRYIELDGFTFENHIITEGKKLGLTESHFNQKISTLSGGEQTKVAFLKLKMTQASLLLIDEPTNHMDSEMKAWLINAFKHEKRAILYVSHDKAFLNNTPDSIIKLTKDGGKKYYGKYDEFKRQIDIEEQTQATLFEKHEREKKAIEETIKKYKEWYHSAAQKASVRDPKAQKKLSKLARKFKSKEKQLNKELIDHNNLNPDKEEQSYSIQHHSFRSRYLVNFKDVTLSFGDNIILDNINLYIERNQNVIIEGANGSGKSSIIKLILNTLVPTTGEIYVHPELKIGYFSQDFNNLNMNRSVLEEISTIPEMNETDARTILASFGFDKSMITATVNSLSMGEKCRLQFVKLYFSNPHLLILDEPTNYFDLEMQEKIIKLIKSFQGSILIVSHDQDFKALIKGQVWTIRDKTLIHENMIVNQSINVDEIKHELENLEQYTDKRNRETEF
ncbi:Sal family ABC-F type ribosomal protection protein [Mammaliicoccus stepanovicii]|uniref:ABC transporter ATPase n=1 Tax=Mammaliicoccus stepanovicii TaxID=643214 RepID=A0A239Z3Y2_9STAP|nr:Sal family ABC-F type ribosomal protection protein [Mammaliicoccus stepanovicii]PNZ72406.1 ABC transporter ATP-binding protein [Mammaliicoccus stepanovicii]GGI40183.1 ABC transporter ATP-binding protein [Mammaliicoccus stepanovicii]SNV65583.1 ABC transporter ATPase [Mammaliicoccus stepanovicii]